MSEGSVRRLSGNEKVVEVSSSSCGPILCGSGDRHGIWYPCVTDHGFDGRDTEEYVAVSAE